MEEETLEKQVICDNDKVEYINGAYGGVGPNNELVVSFFHEHLNLNHAMTHEGEPPKVVLDIKNTFVMNFESMKKIHKWLGNQIKAVEDADDSDKEE